jgi:hypothetical protein
MYIFSFYVFLESINASDMMLAAIFLDTYQAIFERPLKSDLSTTIIERLRERLGPEVITNVTKYALDEQELDNMRKQHQLYQEVAQLYNTGLKFLLQKK